MKINYTVNKLFPIKGKCRKILTEELGYFPLDVGKNTRFDKVSVDSGEASWIVQLTDIDVVIIRPYGDNRTFPYKDWDEAKFKDFIREYGKSRIT